LDKFSSSEIGTKVFNRDDAMMFAEKMKHESFRAGLLISFLAIHNGHDCIFFDEYTSLESKLNPHHDHNNFVQDHNFWK